MYGSLLQSCILNGDYPTGKSLHCEIIKKGNCLDLFASNILLNLYVKDDSLPDAVKLFDEMPGRNTVSFVTLIQGYSQCFRFSEAIGLFSRLREEGHELNPFVFSTVLKLLVSAEWVKLGFSVHACVCKLGFNSDAFVGTALIDCYSVCGYAECARQVFDAIEYKDMVSWTGMVTCYAENECFEESLKIFSQMRIVGFKPNKYTFASVLKACVGLEVFNVGKAVHGCAFKTSHLQELFVGVELIDLYIKSGDVDDALQVFEEMPKDDVIPWSFMIARYAQSGQSEEAIEMFCRMRQGLVLPNQFTLASLLQACASLVDLQFGNQIHCHVVKVESPNCTDVSWNTVIVGYVQAGNGEKALGLFKDMLESQVQGSEAAKLVHEIPLEPSVMVWRALLSACVIHNDVELGRISAQRALEIEPEDEATHGTLHILTQN
ncbi:hypothetical protein OIU74_014260 [Salix koriyanagi]|uniref:Pentatricopeptide repeat-containing protein n=1 Tax=Salix koriyanagi TaxID=2511006 RepID=A0A9Q0PW50_9ROSI|nr:hypothetical protein OIU74_014260 [Salix koriyanagi]